MSKKMIVPQTNDLNDNVPLITFPPTQLHPLQQLLLHPQ